MQARIRAVADQQISVRTLLHELPALEDENAIGVLNGGESVRDHEHGAPFEQPVDRFLHQPFALHVERRGGLVENENGRI